MKYLLIFIILFVTVVYAQENSITNEKKVINNTNIETNKVLITASLNKRIYNYEDNIQLKIRIVNKNKSNITTQKMPPFSTFDIIVKNVKSSEEIPLTRLGKNIKNNSLVCFTDFICGSSNVLKLANIKKYFDLSMKGQYLLIVRGRFFIRDTKKIVTFETQKTFFEIKKQTLDRDNLIMSINGKSFNPAFGPVKKISK